MLARPFYKLSVNSYLEYTTSDALVVYLSDSKKTLLLPPHLNLLLDLLKESYPQAMSLNQIANGLPASFKSPESLVDDLKSLAKAELVVSF